MGWGSGAGGGIGLCCVGRGRAGCGSVLGLLGLLGGLLNFRVFRWVVAWRVGGIDLWRGYGLD